MPKPLTKPPLYRLTLVPDAMAALVSWLDARKRGAGLIATLRADGKYDVAITYGLLDQLQTAALPKENLSDTVLRIMAKEPS